MTFAIDTGAPAQVSIGDYVPDWFKDTVGEMPEDRLAHDFAYHMIGDMNNPKQIKTVRKHMVAQWAFLRLLSDLHPEVFDELLTAYAERVLS